MDWTWRNDDVILRNCCEMLWCCYVSMNWLIKYSYGTLDSSITFLICTTVKYLTTVLFCCYGCVTGVHLLIKWCRRLPADIVHRRRFDSPSATSTFIVHVFVSRSSQLEHGSCTWCQSPRWRMQLLLTNSVYPRVIVSLLWWSFSHVVDLLVDSDFSCRGVWLSVLPVFFPGVLLRSSGGSCVCFGYCATRNCISSAVLDGDGSSVHFGWTLLRNRNFPWNIAVKWNARSLVLICVCCFTDLTQTGHLTVSNW